MASWRFLLYPFSILYDGVTRLRNTAFDKGILPQTSFDIPVIAIGNLSTGGTGKTPMIEYCVKQLKGKKVAVLSRGYGRKSKGFIEVATNMTAAEVGDEPLQFKLKYQDDLIVAVCENRVDGINKLMESHNLDAILLDDAYQHRYVKASQYIMLTDYNAPFYDDFVLPAGNLREARCGSKRADHIVITKCPPDLSQADQDKIRSKVQLIDGQKLFFSKIEYADHIYNENKSLSLSQMTGSTINLVTGIAKPHYLKDFLEDNFTVRHFNFSDHHDYRKEDLEKLETSNITITTEKDFTKLKHLKIENLYYLPIETSFIGADLEINISDS